MINLDHNATTPVLPSVRQALCEWLELAPQPANPSSIHGLGRASRDAVERARRRVGRAIGADPMRIIWTAGGTEANNLAIFGACRWLGEHRRGILVSPLEHPSVLAAVQELADRGHNVTYLRVDAAGRIDPVELAQALRVHRDKGRAIGFLSLAAANHELGNAYDVATLVATARSVAPELLIHCDAVQALGKMAVDATRWDVDLLSISGHKIGGLAGAGALYAGPRVRLAPQSFGGKQERGQRAGTEPVVAILALGAACDHAVREDGGAGGGIADLRARLRDGLQGLGARIHGDPERHLPNTLNFAFSGCEGELVAMNLDLGGFAVSTGAACSSGVAEPSPVLLALGRTPSEAREAVRVSLGWTNTADDIERFLAALVEILPRIRAADRRGAS
jgi:cysteine desulfurase